MTDYSLISHAQRRIESDGERLARYERNWEYYNGRHSQPMKVLTGQADDNVIVNLARLIVDKGVSFLMGKELQFELVEGDTTPEEEYLDAVWQRNRKMTLLSKVAMTGGIYGHMFIKVVPGDDDVPRLVNLEPEYVRVEWDDQDIERVLAYIIEWEAMGADGKPLFRRQTITDDGDRWQIENRIARAHNKWSPDPDNPDVVWGWPWAPIVDAQNIPYPGSFYGLGDIDDLGEQDAINYLASKINRIIRYHAHPKTIGTGFQQTQMSVGAGEMLILPSSESKIYNLEMESDLSAAIAFLDRLISLFMRQSRVPDLNPVDINLGAMSGFALQILYGDLLEKTELKRRTYGDLLVELNRRLLDMAGYGTENYTTIHWQDPLPVDEQAEMTRDQFELGEGLVSKETVRTRRGLDNEAEIERIGAEKAASGNIGAVLMRNFMNGQGAVQRERQEEPSDQQDQAAA